MDLHRRATMSEFKVRIEGVSTVVVTGMNIRTRAWVGRLRECVVSFYTIMLSCSEFSFRALELRTLPPLSRKPKPNLTSRWKRFIRAGDPILGSLSAKLQAFLGLGWGLGFNGPRTKGQPMVEFKVRIEGVSTMVVTGTNMRPEIWVGRLREYVAAKPV